MKNGFIVLALTSSLAISLSAFANKGAPYQPPVQQKQGAWYIGAGVNGSSQFSLNTISGVSLDNYSTFAVSVNEELEQESANLGFDVYVGYDLSKYWAVELGYTYVGNIRYDSEIHENLQTQAEVKQWNAHVVGLGKLPVGEYVNFFLKGGIAYYANKTVFDTFNVHGVEHYEYDETTDSLTLTYGAGAELHWENWGIRGEYNVIWPANNIRNEFAIADIISANIYYKFM